MAEDVFRFKEFSVVQDSCAMKINTDGILLGAWCDVQSASKVLDIGTGTGVIALMIAQRNKTAGIVGLDIDKSSAERAAKNFMSSAFSSRLLAMHTSVQEYSEHTSEKFDMIVCNPPFFSEGTISQDQRKAGVKHTIHLSHSDLLTAVCKLLEPGGVFNLVLPYREGMRLLDFSVDYGLFTKILTKVQSKHQKPLERLLIGLTNVPGKQVVNHLIIHDRDNPKQYSKEYVELTSPFYLFM